MTTPDTTSGLFAVFEGGDGVGKSIQVVELVTRLQNRRVEPVLTRQPGGTPIGAKLRKLLLDPGHPELTVRIEALVYIADKVQHVEEVILPALARDDMVVCDRYVDSMIAYQGAGRVLDLIKVGQVARRVTGRLRPGLTVLFDINPAEVVANIRQQDHLEAAGLEFHRRAREHFLRLAGEDPERYLALGARESRESTAEKAAKKVFALFDRVNPTLKLVEQAVSRPSHPQVG